jgi:hypothetical protein
MECAYTFGFIYLAKITVIYAHQRKRRKIIPVNLKANVFSSVYKIGKKSPTFAKDKLITFWLNLDEKLAKVKALGSRLQKFVFLCRIGVNSNAELLAHCIIYA